MDIGKSFLLDAIYLKCKNFIYTINACIHSVFVFYNTLKVRIKMHSQF